jgi:hypothetical protein
MEEVDLMDSMDGMDARGQTSRTFMDGQDREISDFRKDRIKRTGWTKRFEI